MGRPAVGVLDDVEMSARELSVLMMAISDNTAAEVVQRRVGTDAISRRIGSLGLTRTSVECGTGRRRGR